ncbi:MAG: VTT domain-containing protein [Leptospiraceae bacterium]|nr:VTT domain-containing protein [Leptospiraceae bacterium]
MEKELKDLLLKTLYSTILIIIAVVILSFFLKQPITEFSKHFIDYFGVIGVGIGILICDSVPALMVPDAFLMFAVASELDDFQVISLASIGSIIGGSISYYLGRNIFPKFKFAKNLLEKHEEKLSPYVEKYGIWAVVLAATTPLPYSWMAIVVGSLKMPFRNFLLGSIARIPRFAVYFYAFKLGWLSS